MVISINALTEPVGSIKSWIRANASIGLPGGWIICDGTTVVDASSEFNGLAVPDLRATFPRGHATLTNANFSADVNYYTGGTIPSGGADSVNLVHSHTSPTHVHGVSINPGGTHGHTTAGATNNPAFGVSPNASYGNDGLHSTHFHTVPVAGSHSHTGSAVAGSAVINPALGSNENRPVYDELLIIIKIK